MLGYQSRLNALTRPGPLHHRGLALGGSADLHAAPARRPVPGALRRL